MVTTQNPSDQQQRISGAEVLREVDVSVIGAATAVVLPGSRFIADKTYILRSLRLTMGTTGTAGQTDVVCNINGAPVAGLTATRLNTDADGSTTVDTPAAETTINPGDVVDLEATAVATANADLTARLTLAQVLG